MVWERARLTWSLVASSQMSSFFGQISQPRMMMFRAAWSRPVTSSRRAAAIQPGGQGSEIKGQGSEVKRSRVKSTKSSCGQSDNNQKYCLTNPIADTGNVHILHLWGSTNQLFFVAVNVHVPGACLGLVVMTDLSSSRAFLTSLMSPADWGVMLFRSVR